MPEPIARLTEALSTRFRIERELGQGGMATVYLAHDVRHDRKVALKVLRPELSAIVGADRFLQEIRTTANLQHPHILQLHDSGEADGIIYYVMPYVEGESLRDKLVRERQLPVDEARRIAMEVADALDYAHRHKVIHRDIKPENILLHDGRAIVADFGIALAVSRSDGSTRMTETGMSLGTPYYMSPEQAMGERDITAAADVYALGCVLYEMLTGEPPFTGPSAQAIIARVLTEEPRSLMVQRRTVSPQLDAAVLQALEKLPADRFPSARAFADAISHNAPAGSARYTAPPMARIDEPVKGRRLGLPAVVAAGVVALAAGLIAGSMLLAPKSPARVVRMSITLPGETPPVAIRLSPDGRTLAYVSGQGDRFAIFARGLDDLEPRRLAGTDDAFTISFSPDGQWIAFLVGTQARKVPVAGGAPVNIAAGGAALLSIEWAGNDRFIVASDGALATLTSDGSLQRFAGGGSETALALEQVLPDGRVLARAWRSPPVGPVMIIDPSSGRRDTIIDADVAWSSYAGGMLAWTLQDGVLYGAPLDLGKRRLGGAGRPLGGTVLSVLGFSPPATLANGGLAYAPTRPRVLARVTRTGASSTILGTDRSYHNPRVSPDGRRISLDFTDQVRDVWLYDIADSTLTRFGFDSVAHDAEWLPDGSGLVFAALHSGIIGMFQRRFDGGARAESLFAGPQQVSVHAITADGKTGIGVAIEDAAFDLVAVRMDGSRLDSVLATRYGEGWPALSPDGRWLAYQTDESGRNEVYVRSWPAIGPKVQVSQNGGTEPAWSRDGKELFYRGGGGAEPMLVAATFEPGSALRVKSRTPLFSVATYEFATPHRNYDVFPDGRSFVMVRQGRPGQLAEVVYIQDPKALLGGR